MVPGLVHQEFAYAAELIVSQRSAGPRGGPATTSARGSGLRNLTGGALAAAAAGGQAAPMAAFDWTDVNAGGAGRADLGDDDDDGGGGGDGGAGWDVGGLEDDGDVGPTDVGLDASDVMAGMRGKTQSTMSREWMMFLKLDFCKTDLSGLFLFYLLAHLMVCSCNCRSHGTFQVPMPPCASSSSAGPRQTGRAAARATRTCAGHTSMP